MQNLPQITVKYPPAYKKKKNSTVDHVVSKVNLNTFKYEGLTDSVFSNQKVGHLAIKYFQTLSELPRNFK